MMNPKSPKRESEIPVDKENVKAPRVDEEEEDQPKTSDKNPNYSNSDTNVDDGPKIKCSDDFDDATCYEHIEGLKKYIVDGKIDLKQAADDGLKAWFEMDHGFDEEEMTISEMAHLALHHFRTQIKGGDYEFVKGYSSILMPAGFYGAHINFFARPKGSDDSSAELFFACLENGEPMEVLECCIINPRPFSPDETPPDDALVVYHGGKVDCNYCNVPIPNIEKYINGPYPLCLW